MLIYIHGYGSCGLSFKARHFQKIFANQQVLAPSLPTDSRLALDTLEQMINCYQAQAPQSKLGLIGSSLGGFWAIYLAEKYQLPALLLNPAIPPWQQYFAGKQLITRPGCSFQWSAEQLARLENYRVKNPSDELQARILLIQQLDDEVLDPDLALNYLPKAQILTGEQGGHRLTTIADYDLSVTEFFKFHRCI